MTLLSFLLVPWYPLRRFLLKLLVVAFLAPLGLALTAAVYLRHKPYQIPKRDRVGALAESAPGALKVRYLGVSGYEITDGKTVIITDPAMTRPTVPELLYQPIRTDDALVEKMVPRADYILINHAHYDHDVDVPSIALRTGAKVVGSPSVLNLARSRGVPEKQLILAKGGKKMQLGTFKVDIRSTIHMPILGMSEPMGGVTPADAGALWFWQYKLDDCFYYRMQSGSNSLWFHPNTVYREEDNLLPAADAMIIGITGSALSDEKLRKALGQARPRVLIPTHFDNFFQPIEKGLALLPIIDYEGVREMVLRHARGASWHLLDYNETIYIR